MRKIKFFLPLLLGSFVYSTQFNPQMQEYINTLKAEAKKENPNFKDFDAMEGKKIFLTQNKGKSGESISCQSCHNSNLKQEAMNYFTKKPIAPLAPSVNPQRLTQVKEVKKWLKRNFRDVFLREGSAIEKGNVLYYLINQ